MTKNILRNKDFYQFCKTFWHSYSLIFVYHKITLSLFRRGGRARGESKRIEIFQQGISAKSVKFFFFSHLPDSWWIKSNSEQVCEDYLKMKLCMLIPLFSLSFHPSLHSSIHPFIHPYTSTSFILPIIHPSFHLSTPLFIHNFIHP